MEWIVLIISFFIILMAQLRIHNHEKKVAERKINARQKRLEKLQYHSCNKNLIRLRKMYMTENEKNVG